MNKMKLKLGLLVPASRQSGLGHYFRTLPIYEWDERVIYVSYDPLISSLGVRHLLLDPGSERSVAEQLGAEKIRNIYIDHYDLNKEILDSLSNQEKINCTFFDKNFENPPFPSLINSSLYATGGLYKRLHAWKKYFLGSDYYLFRKEIMRWRGGDKQKSCFVCFGGTDASGQMLKIIPLLGAKRRYQLVLGPGVGREYVQEVQKCMSRYSLNAELHVNPANFFEIMSSCDRAVVTCSTIAHEALFLGLKIHCIVVAENQNQLAKFFRGAGIPVSYSVSEGLWENLGFSWCDFSYGKGEMELKQHLLSF